MLKVVPVPVSWRQNEEKKKMIKILCLLCTRLVEAERRNKMIKC